MGGKCLMAAVCFFIVGISFRADAQTLLSFSGEHKNAFELHAVFSTYYKDADGDGFGIGEALKMHSDPGNGYTIVSGDCDDFDKDINPGRLEVCNGFDDDCNGIADDGIAFSSYFTDLDNDGFGTEESKSFCSDPGMGYTIINGDCDDVNGTVHPGSKEICNGFDDDCNGIADDGIFTVYYTDLDNDGFGTDEFKTFCNDPGIGYTTMKGDCDDADASINPASAETENNFDDDCNGVKDDGIIFTTYFTDLDNDGFGTEETKSFSYDPGKGYSTTGGDCDDANRKISPAAGEICNGIDDDCNGIIDEGLAFTTYYADQDGDGFGTGEGIYLCTDPGMNYTVMNGDCDDLNWHVNPSMDEIKNSIDDNCNGNTDEGINSENPQLR